MDNFFTYFSNKCKQYAHRIFYIAMNNTTILHFTVLVRSLITLDKFITKNITRKEVYIVLISENILFKTIIFTYCFATGSKLIMISPKFSISEILNTILSKRGVNLLLVDHEILLKIKETEEEEGVNILQFFTHVETTLKMLEILLEDSSLEESTVGKSMRHLTKKGLVRRLSNNAFASILSPGTTSEPSITNVSYKTFGDSILNLSAFMGLKPSDKVSVIADFELFPTFYTILGLLNGNSFVQLEKDAEISSHTELKEMLNKSNHKPNVFFISTNNFRNIWDSILLHIYSIKLLLFLSRFSLTKWIVNYFIRREVRSTFGKQAKKVHIINEELGFSVLDILKNSKIMFSSSYGFLEQGNFLAFKDTAIFRNKEFIFKPGGSIFKNININIDKLIFEGMKSQAKIGRVYIPESKESLEMDSDDAAMLIPNHSEQGDRKYLYIYGRRKRLIPYDLRSLDIVERTIKDTLLIRDCFIREYFNNVLNSREYEIFIEPREDLLDAISMPWDEYHVTIQKYLSKLKTSADIDISHFAILKFNGMRNFAGKLQYYTI